MASGMNKTKTNQPKKDVAKANNLMKDIFAELDNDDDDVKPYIPSNIKLEDKKAIIDIAPEFEKKLTTGIAKGRGQNVADTYEIPHDLSIMDVDVEPVVRNSSSAMIGREVVKKDNIAVNRTPEEKTSKRTREEFEAKITTDSLNLLRTPNSVVNSAKSEYYTPNSNIPERTERGTERTPYTGVKKEQHTPDHLLNSGHSESSNISSRQTISIDKIPKNEDGSLSVYWYDACEEIIKSEPVVILFCKIYDPATKQYTSISLVFRNLQRVIYLFPKLQSENDDSYNLQEIYDEFEYLRKSKFSYIRHYKAKEVKRKYCFELPIAHKEHRVLKVIYPAEFGTLPANLQGEKFEYVFGKNSSLLERVLLKLKLKGPFWLRVTNFEQPSRFTVSWSNFEVDLKGIKECIAIDTTNKPAPPLKVLSISTKCITQNGVNELMCICATLKEDYRMDDSKVEKDTSSYPLIVLRKLDIPVKIDQINDFFKKRYGEKNFLLGQNENAIINQFIVRLSQFDPDVIVGHGLYTGHLEMILNRISQLKLANWSKVGKLKREVIPKFLQSNSIGNIYVRNCIMGRLICDTLLSCKDMIRESNYQLSYLTQRYLDKQLPELDNTVQIPTSNHLDELKNIISITLDEAYYSFGLMDKFGILPLTKQLTTIAGNLWNKSLQNSRADRCEMLLNHEFYRLKYLIPDKITKTERFEENEEAVGEKDNEGKRKPQYAGGLVLEPIAGLYDTIVLLLDFNSLYPSIIQEYNICFTTVNRKPTQVFNYIEDKRVKAKKGENTGNIVQDENDEVDINLSAVKNVKEKAILPSILESLVQKRKVVKDLIKKERDPLKLATLEIKQKAIKLSANSLYGYLGYKNSKYFAKAIAALITLQGRNILKDTVKLVTEKLNLQVIYGDTDSIMINTLTNDLHKALELGQEAKRNVNLRYRLLEMEMDGVFKSILLLKKKKYAALKYDNPYDPKSKLSEEHKGLDLVRRDWCDLSKEVGKKLLKLVLSGQPKEDIINQIFLLLKEVSEGMDSNTYPIDLYLITKQLTKNIEDYNDIKSQPHVKVAKRLKDNGDNSIKVNTFIQYVICNDQTNVGAKALAEKAFSPKEFETNSNISIDMPWYKQNQILASASRLLKHITEIDMYQLANHLGLDAAKYNLIPKKDSTEDNTDIFMENETVVKLIAKYGINIKCPKCQVSRKVDKILDMKSNLISLVKCNSVSISALII
jgi:DNA polymerase alpha subunit A